MKAAITDGKGKVWIEAIPLPTPGEYECLCKIEACAICSGTDLKLINNEVPWAQSYPGLLGHESIGRVVELGSKVRNIKKGDRFLRPSAAYPGEKLNKYCSAWGGMAEYGIVTDSDAMKEDRSQLKLNGYIKYQQALPDDLDISAPDATMLITFKETASYVTNTGVGLHKSLLIMGTGPVALSMLRFAKIFGAYPVIVLGRREEALFRARKIGANLTINCLKNDFKATVKKSTRDKGLDFIIDTTGSYELLKDTVSLLAPGGKIAPYAIYKDGTRELGRTIDANCLANSSVNEELMHQYLVDAINLSLLKPEDFYSHKMPFEEIEESFELLKNKKAFKIILEM